METPLGMCVNAMGLFSYCNGDTDSNNAPVIDRFRSKWTTGVKYWEKDFDFIAQRFDNEWRLIK